MYWLNVKLILLSNITSRPDSVHSRIAMYLDVFFRFDDETGEIHNPRIDRNALRHLFTKKTERERLEKQQRETILQVSFT